jgi:hypothetical protein
MGRRWGRSRVVELFSDSRIEWRVWVSTKNKAL